MTHTFNSMQLMPMRRSPYGMFNNRGMGYSGYQLRPVRYGRPRMPFMGRRMRPMTGIRPYGSGMRPNMFAMGMGGGMGYSGYAPQYADPRMYGGPGVYAANRPLPFDAYDDEEWLDEDDGSILYEDVYGDEWMYPNGPYGYARY